jgi:predicted phage terminase large subunit-like protein
MRIHLHNRGPALWPEVFGLAQLLRRRREVGEEHFATAYQGEPTAGADAVFKETWLRYYDGTPRTTQCWQAWDTAQAGGASHDYSCCVTGGRGLEGKLYVLDVWRGKVDAPELKAQIVALAARWKARRVLIEEASAGRTVMDILRAERGLPLVGVKTMASKLARARGATIHLSEARVLLPAEAPWLDDFREELLAFPQVAHDDQVDAFVHLVVGMLGTRVMTEQQAGSLRRPAGW